MRHKLLSTLLTLSLIAMACQQEATGPAPLASDSGLSLAAVVVWKGYTWQVRGNATAAVDGDDNLIVTRTGAGDVGVEISPFDPTINASGTPWMLFSYIDAGPHVSQGYDMFINADQTGPRISGGSLFSFDVIGWERFDASAQEDPLFISEPGSRSGGPHTVYVGQRSDGTMDAIVDGTWWEGSFLKDNGQAPFDFLEVFLRVRDTDGAAGDRYTFTDFRAGDNHPGGDNQEACKDEGWSESGLWTNQGQCIQYANTSDQKAQVFGS